MICPVPGCKNEGHRGRREPHLCDQHYAIWLMTFSGQGDSATHRQQWLWAKQAIEWVKCHCGQKAIKGDYLCERCRLTSTG